jgi:uncharacterized membrane protein YedE/YeeE
MKFFTALLAGALFGSGLLISGMLDPANVLGFLDFFGEWRPQLALVMGGAVVVAAPAFLYVRRSARNALGERVELPDRRRIDAPLLLGATVFGLGWGLVGICPGPGLALLATRDARVYCFVGAMLVGMWLVYRVRERPARRQQVA